MLVPRKLLKEVGVQHTNTPKPLPSSDPSAVDIAAISAIGFYFNIYRKDNKVFITSLYEINRIISEREEELAKETDKKLVKRLLPTIYARYKSIFLKAALDKLSPYRTYDYKIQLEANNSLSYSPLY